MPVRPSKRLIPMLAVAAVLLNVDPAFACSPKWKSYAAAVKSDLRNLMVAEDVMRVDSGRYSARLEETVYRPAAGIAVSVHGITDSGYYAVATHAKLPKMRCRMFIGTKPELPELARAHEGEAVCDGTPPDAPAFTVSTPVILSFFAFLLALTLTAFVFLREPGRRNWPGVFLAMLTLFYGAIMAPFCGRTPVEGLALVAALGMLLFTYAVHRHLRSPPLSS